MKPIKFPEVNRILHKPESMTDEECISLPVFTDGEICVSKWKLTLRERLGALLFGTIWVMVLSGRTQPPMALTVGNLVFDTKKKEDE